MNIKSLTSLRGVASLIVVATHILAVFDLPRLLQANGAAAGSVSRIMAAFLERTFNGSAAVEIFFVLSGCVLAMSLKEGAASKPAWIKVFYIKRIVRIYPALWLSIGLTVCLWPLIRMGFKASVLSDWASSAFPENLTFRLVGMSLTGMYVHLNWPIWTLRIELFYSTLFPALFLMIRNQKARLPLIALLAIVAVAPLPRNWSLHYALAFGIGAAIPYTNGIRDFYYRLCALALSPVLMYLRSGLAGTGLSDKNIETVEMLVASAIIYCLFHNRRQLPILDGRLFYFLGKISYSVYILHFPIVFAVAGGIVNVLGQNQVQRAPLLITLLLGVLTLLFTLSAATLSYRLIEHRGIRFGKLLAALASQRTAAAVPPVLPVARDP
ncbi:MAG: acyltransferase family protein [Janthinobacterium lividum]